MEKEDVFKFEDFIDVEKLTKMKSNLIKEGIISESGSEDDDEYIDQSLNPYKYDDNTDSIHNKMLGNEDEENLDYIDIEEDEYDDNTNNIHNKMLGYNDDNEEEINQELNPYKFDSDDEFYSLDKEEINEVDEDDNEELEELGESNYYKLFRDKAEDFVCDIAIEGVSQSNTEVRLIVESDDWTLMFTGEVKNGKCIIPIKKLNILNEGQTGNIRLEVNADGNLFTPWEDRFVVKASKKVSVKVNENQKTIKSKPGVKVNVKR